MFWKSIFEKPGLGKNQTATEAVGWLDGQQVCKYNSTARSKRTAGRPMIIRKETESTSSPQSSDANPYKT